MHTRLRYTLAVIAGLAALFGCDRSSPAPTATRTIPIDGPNRTAAVGYANMTIARTNLGSINYKTNLNKFNVELKTQDDADIEVTHGVAQAGGNTGWHYHPGPVLVMVESGSLTVYEADDPTCTGKTYAAGSTFIEGTTPHIVRNEGATTAEIIGVFLEPAGQPRRIESSVPGNCPF
jgi:quercetin dioxygenase-like cupin family protein